jgi:hypothetical protein
MIDIILLLLLNSLYVLGFYLSLQQGMVFSTINTYGELYLKKLWMPIGGCVTCMASVHSWVYFLFYDLDLLYLVYICALATVNTIIYNKYLADD